MLLPLSFALSLSSELFLGLGFPGLIPSFSKNSVPRKPCRCRIAMLSKGDPRIKLPSLWGTGVSGESLNDSPLETFIHSITLSRSISAWLLSGALSCRHKIAVMSLQTLPEDEEDSYERCYNNACFLIGQGDYTGAVAKLATAEGRHRDNIRC